MPTFDYVCEVCGTGGREWRVEKPPRFCDKKCMSKGMAGVSRKPRKYFITPEIHERIRRVYQRDTGNGQVAALARAIKFPRWKVTRHAISQGWIAKQKKEPNWSDAELEALERSAHLSPERIQAKMKICGFKRSVYGILLKRKRMRMLRNLKGQSARSLAQCLGVDDHFVTRAIQEGRLRAKRRGTKRVKKQGGDHWFIRDRHARQYVVDNIHEIDIRKVDKYWFVDLLAGGARGRLTTCPPLAD